MAGDDVEAEAEAAESAFLDELVERIEALSEFANAVTAKVDTVHARVSQWLNTKSNLTVAMEKARAKAGEELDCDLYNMLPAVRELAMKRYRAKELYEQKQLKFASLTELAKMEDAINDFDKAMDKMYARRTNTKDLLETLKRRILIEGRKRKKMEREAIEKAIAEYEEVPTEEDEPEVRQRYMQGYLF
jgi:hypothetical protein